MGKVIEINKNTSRADLDKELAKLSKPQKIIDLSKYAGKIDFGIDGLAYQLKIRDEWR